MRLDCVIFYFENNTIGNAHRRCLLNKTKGFRNSIKQAVEKAPRLIDYSVPGSGELIWVVFPFQRSMVGAITARPIAIQKVL